MSLKPRPTYLAAAAIAVVCAASIRAQSKAAPVPAPSLCLPAPSQASKDLHFELVDTLIDSLLHAREARELESRALDQFNDAIRTDEPERRGLLLYGFFRGIKGARDGLECAARLYEPFLRPEVEESVRQAAGILVGIFTALSESETSLLLLVEEAVSSIDFLSRMADHGLAKDRDWKLLTFATAATMNILVGFEQDTPEDATLSEYGFSRIDEAQRKAALLRLKNEFGESIIEGPQDGHKALEGAASLVAITLDTTIKQLLARKAK